MSAIYKVTFYAENGSTNQAETFVGGLSKQCGQKYLKLKRNLEDMGPKLAGTPMYGHIDGDVWELRELCDSGALRLYVFRDQRTFYIVTAEIKNNGRKQPNSVLTKAAQRCCDEHKRSQK